MTNHKRRYANPQGMTLLELVAVLTVMSILTGIAVARMTTSTVSALGTKVDARRLALDLMQARRRAIATGDNHLLVFQTSGGTVTGYTLHRRLSSTTEAVDTAREFTSGVTITGISPSPEFDFQGQGLATYTLTLSTAQRSWQVQVVQTTGAVRVTEL